MDNIDQGIKAEKLALTEASLDFFKESAKWAKFLAIVGFVMLGIMVLASLIMIGMMASLAGAPAAGLGLVYLLMAALYFFPTLYLYKFAVKTKNAIETYSENGFEDGAENLKSMFKFMGILMIVVLSLYALMFIIGLIGGATRSF